MASGALVCILLLGLAWIGTLLSGTVLIHPLICAIGIIGCAGLYLMSRMEGE